MSEIESNSLKAKVYIACGSDETLKPSLCHVLFSKNLAIATDGNILVACDLSQDLSEATLEYLDGKMMHKDLFKNIMYQAIDEPDPEIIGKNQLCVLHEQMGKIIINLKTEKDFKDDLFPDWKKFVPAAKSRVAMQTIPLSLRTVNTVRAALIRKGCDQDVTFEFHGEDKPIIIRPIDTEMGGSYALIKPLKK